MSSFATPITDRYFEDYKPGSVHEFGSVTLDRESIIRFAEQYDPQPFHVDEAAASATIFEGLIASGWQTCGLMMRMYADNYLTKVASLASPGVDELRWISPVRPGDSLSVRCTVVESRRSQSRPDRGVVHTFIEVLNQHREVVLSMKAVNMIACREVAE